MGNITHWHPPGVRPRYDSDVGDEGIDMRQEPAERDAGAGAEERRRATSRRRLGSVEYVLLALVALGVAITITMAVIDPSG